MKCLQGMAGTLYQPEIVKKLTDLYTFKGKDFYYEDVLKSYMAGIINETIEKDSFYASLILELNVTESRKKAILKKDSEPKTKDEKVLANLKRIFTIIQEKGTELELTDNEFLLLANMVFDGTTKIHYRTETKTIKTTGLFDDKLKVSMRESMAEEIKEYKKAILHDSLEPVSVITSIYVDLLNMECFSENNKFISLIIAYALLFSQRFNVFKYMSFFEIYYNSMNELKVLEAGASLNWDLGHSNTNMLYRALIDLLLGGYTKTEKLVVDFNFDKKLRKIDNVEATIMRLPTIFTRKDLKEACPRLSDSTINRALEDLKTQGKIRPNGTGRSASWMKIVDNEAFSISGNQINIFEFMDEN